MSYTPDMFSEPHRIVPHDEGKARLAALREALDPPAPTQGAPLCVVGARIYMQHELGRDGHCARCGWRYPDLRP